MTPRNKTGTAFSVPRPLWLLLGLGVWLGFLAWARVLTLPDEGRYAGVAWEMLRSGSHAVPLLDGMPYFHKPPLYYWLAEIGFRLFGLNAWAARMPSWLAAWAALSGLYFFVRRYRDAMTATIAVIVLATTPFFYGGAQFANTDMLVAGFITLSILAAADGVLRAEAQQPFRLMSIAAAMLAALAVLAKGLIGLVLPGATICFWLLLTRRWHGFRVLLWLPALLAFAIVAVPWFWLMQMRFPGFFHYFFVYQHFERFAQSGFNNSQPFWFYLPVTIGLILPWSLWGGGVLRKDFWQMPDPSGLRSLMAIWVVVIVGFFSIPSSKLIGYIVPALPPLAVIIAEVIRRAANQSASGQAQRWAYRCVAGSALLCVLLVCIFVVNPRRSAEFLGQQMAAEMRTDDTLVTLHSYPFDLGIYTGAARPAWVVDDWSNPNIPLRDNWRKELYDAGLFDPQTAARVLISPSQLASRLCAATPGSRFWIWGEPEDAQRYPVLRSLTPKFSDRHYTVWHIDINHEFTARLCGETPKADLPGK